jgi:hypothetical protein
VDLLRLWQLWLRLQFHLLHRRLHRQSVYLERLRVQQLLPVSVQQLRQLSVLWSVLRLLVLVWVRYLLRRLAATLVAVL